MARNKSKRSNRSMPRNKSKGSNRSMARNKSKRSNRSMTRNKSKTSKRKNGKKAGWLLHDTYAPGVSFSRTVTRSQTSFLRVKNTPSDLDLFSDRSRHQPPGMPHLMETMKGMYGSVPRTIITRSSGKYIGVDENLCDKLELYKNYELGDPRQINPNENLREKLEPSKDYEPEGHKQEGPRQSENQRPEDPRQINPNRFNPDFFKSVDEKFNQKLKEKNKSSCNIM